MKRDGLDALFFAAGSLQNMLSAKDDIKSRTKKAKAIKSRFLNPKNLEYLARIALDEKKEVEFLMTGIKDGVLYKSPGDAISDVLKNYGKLEVMLYSSLPKNVVSTSEGYRQILETAKPHFTELTGIFPLEEPSIEIITSKAKAAYGIARPVIGSIFILCTLIGGVPLIAGAGIYVSLAAALVPSVALSSAAFAAAYWKIRNTAGFAMPSRFQDKIYIGPYPYVDAAMLVCHEYAHNLRYKAGSSTSEPFLEEGLATAVASKILKMHENTSHTELAAYGAMEKVCRSLKSFAMLSRCFGLELNIWSYHPFSLDLAVSPKKMFNSSLFNYICGASMVDIAEYKYGRKVYADILNGELDCLLD